MWLHGRSQRQSTYFTLRRIQVQSLTCQVKGSEVTDLKNNSARDPGDLLLKSRHQRDKWATGHSIRQHNLGAAKIDFLKCSAPGGITSLLQLGKALTEQV